MFQTEYMLDPALVQVHKFRFSARSNFPCIQTLL